MPNKSMQIMFASALLVLYVLMYWTGDWVWGYFTRHPNDWILISGALAASLATVIALYKNDRVYILANDVAGELKKVTWPTRKEVQAATIVVIITVVIAAIILGLVFDFIWSKLTDAIYG